jgi:HEAT repeat protein
MKSPVILSLLLLAFVYPVYGLNPAEVDQFEADLSEALLDMGMTPADFRIRHDYAVPDVFRLPLVDSLMYDPASLLERTDALALDVEGALSLHGKALTLWHAMSIEPTACDIRDYRPIRIRNNTGSIAHLPSSLRDGLEDYIEALGIVACFREVAFRDVETHLDFLYDNLPSLVAPSEEYEDVGPFELHRLEKAEVALNHSVLRVCENIDVRAISAMSYLAIRSAERLSSAVGRSLPVDKRYERYSGGSLQTSDLKSTVTGPILYMGCTSVGPVVVGGTSPNTYHGCFALIVDLGGDDTYDLFHQREVSFRVIIDYDGSDSYRSSETCTVAGAIMGTSVIMDFAGDDTYRASGTSLGAGICGAGVLFDKAGNDSYTSEEFSQGAGFLGLGILHDASGHDTYTAGWQSQAFGYVMGSGLLLESGGNDTYYTRMAQTDILRYDDHYLTLSQGCAFGSRPDYSGGIGLLIDSRGNDLYSSDIFGQGVAYWFAVGAIVDRQGHDTYCSYQYAQGAGIHLAFGLLVDENGDDSYQSKGVSHGCGHDLSLGLLADFSGNDSYTATDLSQGAGNANGTGILYDADGTDSYASKSTVNVNGYGDYRREFGSIGLHVDRRGKDFYTGRGDNEALWESGQYGLGIDFPGEATKPRGDLVVKAYPFERREYTPEELFILSSRGEPRFQAWRTYAFDKMVEDTASSIQYLRTVLDTKDARERHTIKDILKKIGGPAVPMLCEAVLEDGHRAQAEASWILGLIGKRKAFDPLLELSYAESWKLRSSALNATGKLKKLPEEDKARLSDRIREVLEDDDEVFYVKKDAVFAAGMQKLSDMLEYLLLALEHDHYSVRFAAAKAIREISRTSSDLVGRELLVHVPHFSASGLVAGLHAAHELPPGKKLEMAESVRRLPIHEEVHVGVALARLLNTVEPENDNQEERLGDLREILAGRSWQAAAMLK